MATTNLLKTRLLQRIDTLENWQSVNPTPLRGEMCVVILGEQSTTNKGLGGDTTKTPIVAVKFGDGTNNFNDLAWSQSCAADVSTFIKSITGEDVFNEKVDARITNAKLATADELASAIARIAQNETDIDALEAVVLTGDDSNAKLRASITANAATAKTQAETAESNAKTYAEEKAAAAQSAAEATAAADATAKVNALETGAVKTNADAISAINGKIGETSIGEVTITAAIKTLQDSVGTSGENSLGSRVDTLEGEMDTAQGDITDLQGRMTTAEGEIDVLQAATQGYTAAGSIATAIADAKKAGTDASDAVSAEASAREAADNALSDRIAKAEAFLNDATLDTEDNQVIDTLKEIQDYIKSDESGAAAMNSKIAANEKALEVLNGTGEGSVAKQIADATANIASDDTVSALADRVATIETDYPAAIANAKAEAINTVVGTAADGSSADTVKGAKKYADEKAAAAQTAATNAAAADATTKANKALADAKTYTDGEITKVNDAISGLSAKTVTTTGEGLVDEVSKDASGNIIATRHKVGVADMADETFVFYCGESDGYTLTSVEI